MDRSAIEKLLEKHLPAKDSEKAEFGEVFTPVPMIEDLLDHFPADAWTNPRLTWLDPASGIGNFPLVIYFRLMKGLARAMPSAAARSRHIITKMLFMVEINPKNAATCRRIFKGLGAEPNIVVGDFLAGDKKPYDFVIGNPPYNIGGTGLEGTKRAHVAFTEAGLAVARRGLAYICPPNYREAGSKMNELFLAAMGKGGQSPLVSQRGHFSYIRIYGATATHKLFKIQGRVDAFLWSVSVENDVKQHSKQTVSDDASHPPRQTTTIRDEYDVISQVRLDLSTHVPNFGFSIFEKLRQKVREAGGAVEAFRNTEQSTVKIARLCGGRHKLLHLIVEGGRRVYKVRTAHKLASVPKLLVNGLGVPYVFYDRNGAYGPSQTPVIVLRPSAALVSLATSPLFSFIAWGLRLTGNNNLPYLFESVPALKGPAIRDIYGWLGLTAEERRFISENFKVYKSADKDLIESCGGGRSTRRIKAAA
jgi:hypothetical protein